MEILRQIENIDHKGLNLQDSVSKIYKTQGVAGLFKGNSASIARAFPFSAIEFYFFELFKNLLIKPINVDEFYAPKNPILLTFISGALTGLTAQTLTFPLDVARTRLAATTHNSIVQESRLIVSLKYLWQIGGIRGLYKGYAAACVVSLFLI